MDKPRIAVIGAGLMGHGIAYLFAAGGYDVRVQAGDALEQLPQRNNRRAWGHASCRRLTACRYIARLNRSMQVRSTSSPGRFHQSAAEKISTSVYPQ
jgi:3-hydroxyacyl-CoA dehydrogenase